MVPVLLPYLSFTVPSRHVPGEIPSQSSAWADEQLDQWADEIYQSLFEEQKTNKEN